MTTQHHAPSPADGLQLVVSRYPWSVLWILTAVALVLILNSSWAAVMLVVALIVAVCAHSLWRSHVDRNREGG